MSEATFAVEDLFDGYEISSDKAGPKYLILVCIHGNETCGVEAILALRDSGELFNLVQKGALTILLANKQAYLSKTRIVNRDLNRSIGKLDLSHSYEKERARLVASLIEKADYILDIHSTSLPSPSHAIPCHNNTSELLASSLCIQYMVTKLAHLTVEGGTTMDYAKSVNTCAVTVECGQHDDKSAIETAKNCIRNFLQDQQLIQCKLQLECKGSIEVKEGFQFIQKFKGFDFIKYKQQVAHDSMGQILCPFKQGAYIVMPNLNPQIGEEAFFWAVKTSSDS
ncbi:MAG: succinylglutamate desuccinylase/aspartoacylase family protein [Candidatus Cloacimonetes bacterium]|nr:succinylglutamate desuccinylase/aspartoacylase family protein [Candidatus Cloacimonadota bacterium]